LYFEWSARQQRLRQGSPCCCIHRQAAVHGCICTQLSTCGLYGPD
jgi:hypothetical protein